MVDMNKKVLGGIIILLVIVGAVLMFKGDGSDTNSANASKGFNMGMISILSGDYAVVGENVRNGAILANEIYNKAHPDAKINLTVEDDGFTGGKGLSAFKKLTSIDKVDALINVSTPTIDSIYETVTKANMPVIQMGEQGREPSDDNVFGLFPSSALSEYDYGVYFKNKGVKEMTLVYTNADAMVRFVEAFKKGFQGKTTEFKIDSAEKDFRTHALKVAGTSPSNIGLFIFPEQGANFMKEFLKIAKNKPQFFFDANFQSGYTDYKRIMGDLTVLDGTFIGTIDSNVSDEFKKLYKEKFGTDPGFLADIGYDAFNLLVKTRDTDGKVWINNVKNISMDGAAGKIEFDSAGNRKPKTKIMIIKDGKISDMN